MTALLLPDWFNPWGWAGLSIIVILICIALIVVILISSKKKAAKEQEEDGVTEEAETKDASKKAAPAKDGAEKEQAKPAVKTENKPAAKSETKAKTYHISKRKEDNRWQVKAAGGEKALKLFNTQAEAIEYAKKVAGNQEANIMVHKEDGSFRKLKY